MPTFTAPSIDLDAAGLQLVADIEAYLRTIPAPARPVAAGASALDLLRQHLRAAPAAPANPYGSVVQAWHAAIPAPRPTLADRLHHRRPVAEVTVRQHLELLSRYIHEKGWLQGALWNDAGAVCLIGAQLRIVQAGYSTPAIVTEARLQLGNQLGRQGEGQPIDTWNDAAGRRVGDVHQLLQQTAARAH